jgi:cytochrome P450
LRITAPGPDSRVPLDQIDLADPDLYASGDAHLVWQTLRAERPLFWQAQRSGPGFWAVSRRADVRRVLSEHETFSSEGGTAIAMLGAPDHAAGLMMHATDPPRHQQFRGQLGPPFSVPAVRDYTSDIRALVKEAVGPALDGGVWDVAQAFASLPMRVAAMQMGLPRADVEPLLRLAYASLAPHDPRYSAGSAQSTAVFAHYEIIQYFTTCITERRKSLSTDLISHLITAEAGGRRLTDEELLLNCLSLLLGAVVTTSHAISATLAGLAGQHGGEGRWPRDASVQIVVEEALRWSSPVTHFMRRAHRDVKLHGETIQAGDAVTAWIASANRDEAVFERPYALDLARTPNRHVTFGYGPHRCLGNNLARLMLRQSFEELFSIVGSFEIAGETEHLISNEIAGLVSLPLRLTLTPGR